MSIFEMNVLGGLFTAAYMAIVYLSHIALQD